MPVSTLNHSFRRRNSYLLPPSAESVNLFQPLQHLIDNRTDFRKIYDTIQTPHTIRLICMRIFCSSQACSPPEGNFRLLSKITGLMACTVFPAFCRHVQIQTHKIFPGHLKILRITLNILRRNRSMIHFTAVSASIAVILREQFLMQLLKLLVQLLLIRMNFQNCLN